MLIFCFFSVTVPSLSGNISILELVHVHPQGNTFLFFIFFSSFLFFFLFILQGVGVRVLVITSTIHVCQFSKARAPVVEVIVVLVAPAAGGVEGA